MTRFWTTFKPGVSLIFILPMAEKRVRVTAPHLCSHGKERPQKTCIDCFPELKCKLHGKCRTTCELCHPNVSGNAITCEHGKNKKDCVQCRPTLLCIHGQMSFNCRTCEAANGRKKCPKHPRILAYRCRDCPKIPNVNQKCEHNRHPIECKYCKKPGEICVHYSSKKMCYYCNPDRVPRTEIPTETRLSDKERQTSRSATPLDATNQQRAIEIEESPLATSRDLASMAAVAMTTMATSPTKERPPPQPTSRPPPTPQPPRQPPPRTFYQQRPAAVPTVIHPPPQQRATALDLMRELSLSKKIYEQRLAMARREYEKQVAAIREEYEQRSSRLGAQLSKFSSDQLVEGLLQQQK